MGSKSLQQRSNRTGLLLLGIVLLLEFGFGSCGNNNKPNRPSASSLVSTVVNPQGISVGGKKPHHHKPHHKPDKYDIEQALIRSCFCHRNMDLLDLLHQQATRGCCTGACTSGSGSGLLNIGRSVCRIERPYEYAKFVSCCKLMGYTVSCVKT